MALDRLVLRYPCRCRRTVVRGIVEVEVALADLVWLAGPLPATNSGECRLSATGRT